MIQQQSIEILALSLEAVKKFESAKPYVIISVRSPEERRPQLAFRENLKGILYLKFHDSEPSWDPEGRHMSENDAMHIKGFLDLHKKAIATVVVQCRRGQCRSTGIAAAIAKAWNIDSTKFWQKPFEPNPHCYDTMLKALSQ